MLLIIVIMIIISELFKKKEMDGPALSVKIYKLKYQIIVCEGYQYMLRKLLNDKEYYIDIVDMVNPIC